MDLTDAENGDSGRPIALCSIQTDMQPPDDMEHVIKQKVHGWLGAEFLIGEQDNVVRDTKQVVIDTVAAKAQSMYESASLLPPSCTRKRREFIS